MNYRFLRDEAARFRTMADETDRETTKLRLLAMATEYEARANAATNVVGPAPAETEEEISRPAEESLERPTKLKLDGKTTRGLKQATLGDPRPTTRRNKASPF